MKKTILSDEARNEILDRQIERIRLEDVNRNYSMVGYTKGAILSPGEGANDIDADGYYSNSRMAYEEGGQRIVIISRNS